MKKNFKWMAALAVAVVATGCSSDDDLMEGHNSTASDDAVKVGVYVPGTSRGVAFNSAAELAAEDNGFELFAYLNDEEGTQFMNGIDFVHNGSNWDYANTGDLKFWSNVGDNQVAFYGVSPMNLTGREDVDATLNITAELQTIGYTVPAQSAQQVDLMYAVTGSFVPSDEIKKNGVKLTFNHALSQIVFSARTVDTYTTADVEEVEIVNLYDKGTYTYPTAVTPDGIGSWKIDKTENRKRYDAEFDATVTVNSTDAVSLTTSANSLLLLPQKFEGAEIADNTVEPAETETGTYLRIKCNIRYTDQDGTTTVVHGSGTATDGYVCANLYYPLSKEWIQGYKYLYTFVFDAKTVADDKDNLVKISEVVVTEWNDGGNTDIPSMQLGEITNPAMARFGDVAMSDGSFVAAANIANITDEQKENAVGIVFWTAAEAQEAGMTTSNLTYDKVMNKDFPNCKNGLIVAMKNMGSYLKWQNNADRVKTFQDSENFSPENKNDYIQIIAGNGPETNMTIHYILGYQNTKILEAYNDYYKGFNVNNIVNPIIGLNDFRNSNPAPKNSTGWFLPSVKELVILCCEDVENTYNDFNKDTSHKDHVNNNFKKLNNSFKALGGEEIYTRPYWTSSEGNVSQANQQKSGSAWFVHFWNITSGAQRKWAGNDTQNDYQTRAVCAF